MILDEYLNYLYEDDILYETVLYMVAESSWKRRLAQGLLRKADLLRIQKARGMPDPLYVKQLLKQRKFKQADEYLKRKGLVKSAKQWLAWKPEKRCNQY